MDAPIKAFQNVLMKVLSVNKVLSKLAINQFLKRRSFSVRVKHQLCYTVVAG